MTDWNEITETIRERVSTWKAGEALGLYVDRHGRCACPMHGGKDRNCRLDKGSKGFHCFVCGGGGDVIHLVEAANGCGFKQAVEWLDSTFSLGLPIDQPASKKDIETARKRREKARKAQVFRDEIRMMEFDTYVKAARLESILRADMKQYRPTDPGQEWDERFCAAARYLPEVKELADEMTVRIMNREDGR